MRYPLMCLFAALLLFAACDPEFEEESDNQPEANETEFAQASDQQLEVINAVLRDGVRMEGGWQVRADREERYYVAGVLHADDLEQEAIGMFFVEANADTSTIMSANPPANQLSEVPYLLEADNRVNERAPESTALLRHVRSKLDVRRDEHSPGESFE